ncbi:MAG: hypothetical protein GX275_09380 [Clostridiales bacterium]|nr:hypothetical protein [Clostridiales bacterium]
MMEKDYKTYVNETKTKLSSVEACITEAHALAPEKDKAMVENVMKSLQNTLQLLSDLN